MVQDLGTWFAGEIACCISWMTGDWVLVRISTTVVHLQILALIVQRQDIPGARWMAKLAKLVIWELSGWTMTQYIKCRVIEEDVRCQSLSSTYRQ